MRKRFKTSPRKSQRMFRRSAGARKINVSSYGRVKRGGTRL